MGLLLSAVMETALLKEAPNVPAKKALEGLTVELAGQKVSGAPHTIWQLLNHLVYWHDLMLRFTEGEKVTFPDAPDPGWAFPEAPRNDAELQARIAQFLDGLERAVTVVQQAETESAIRPDHPAAELHLAVGHTAYHLGQIVLLRSLLNAWPPPGGGYQWS